MALKLAVAAGEQIVDSVEVPGGWWSNSWRFGFAVTREALYVPTKKRGGLVLWEPLEQRRIPVSLVHVVRLREAGVERFQFWATAVMVFVALGFLLLSIFGIAGWERRNGGMFVFLAAIGGLWLYGSGGEI